MSQEFIIWLALFVDDDSSPENIVNIVEKLIQINYYELNQSNPSLAHELIRFILMWDSNS